MVHLVVSTATRRVMAMMASIGSAVCISSYAGDESSAESVLIVAPSGADLTAAVEFHGLPLEVSTGLSGLSNSAGRWREICPVRVKISDGSTPAILGSYTVAGATVTFTPRFPWTPGVAYEAEFCASLLGDTTGVSPVKISFMIAKPVGTAAFVKSVYPSGNDIPENQLKFYLHFSQPMARGDSYRHLALVGGDGRIIADPFLELGEELWNASGTRMTLLVDPGRIKRGLKPREDVGPVFKQGRAYKLVVRPTWQDATGRPLQETYEKSYRVGPPDMDQPSIDRWIVHTPSPNSRSPLSITFDEPLDHALVQHSLVVSHESSVIEGSVTMDRQETVWRFTPDDPWVNGRYCVDISPTLEDLAGNSLGRPFEVELSPAGQALPKEVFRRQFFIEADSN